MLLNNTISKMLLNNTISKMLSNNTISKMLLNNTISKMLLNNTFFKKRCYCEFNQIFNDLFLKNKYHVFIFVQIFNYFCDKHDSKNTYGLRRVTTKTNLSQKITDFWTNSKKNHSKIL